MQLVVELWLNDLFQQGVGGGVIEFIYVGWCKYCGQCGVGVVVCFIEDCQLLLIYYYVFIVVLFVVVSVQLLLDLVGQCCGGIGGYIVYYYQFRMFSGFQVGVVVEYFFKGNGGQQCLVYFVLEVWYL